MSGPDLGRQYEDHLLLTEIYEWAGFHADHAAAHHGTPHRSAPSPGLFLAAVAQRTTKLRFGPPPIAGALSSAAPIEEICMLDVMSGGRIELGVGRGASPYEAAFFGIDPATAQERGDETQEIELKGLAPRASTMPGKFFTLRTSRRRKSRCSAPTRRCGMSRVHWSAPIAWQRSAATWSLAMASRDPGRFTRLDRAAWAARERAPEDMPFVGNTRNGCCSTSTPMPSPRPAAPSCLVRFHGPSVACRPASSCLVRSPHPASTKPSTRASSSPARPPRCATVCSATKDLGHELHLCRFACGDLSFEELARSVRLFAREGMPARCSWTTRAPSAPTPAPWPAAFAGRETRILPRSGFCFGDPSCRPERAKGGVVRPSLNDKTTGIA